MPRLSESLKTELDQTAARTNLRGVDPARMIEIRAHIAALEALQEIASALEAILARLPAPGEAEAQTAKATAKKAAAPK